MNGLEVVRDVSCRLANDLQLSHDAVLKKVTLQKLVVGDTGKIGLQACYRIQDMLQVDRIIPLHKG